MANAGGTTIGPDEGRVEGEPSAPSAKPRWRELPFLLLVVVLVAAIAVAGTVWWTHRSHDLGVGSKHRVAISVREVHQGDCMNNIDLVTVDGHHFSTDAHAPETWGTGEVTGTLVVTARPGSGPPGPATTAVFTADGHDETVDFIGGTTGVYFDDLTCLVS